MKGQDRNLLVVVLHLVSRLRKQQPVGKGQVVPVESVGTV